MLPTWDYSNLEGVVIYHKTVIREFLGYIFTKNLLPFKGQL